MAILQILIEETGLIGVFPNWDYIETDDTLATVLQPGYLDDASRQGFFFSEKACALVYTTDYGSVPLQITINQATRVITLVYRSGTGAVNSVIGTTGQIVSSGGANPMISLANVAGVAGSYTNANITVDGFGRISAAANGSSGAGVVDSVTGTAGRITVDSTDPQNPIVNIDNGYVGQASITTVGTITAGIWNGGILSGQYGGTGVNNVGKTIALGGSLSTIGAFTSAFTMTGNTAVTFPTTGVLATTSNTVASVTGTAGQIAVTGTANDPIIGLVATAVVPGSYTYTNLTVDSFGRLTAAASGVAPVTAITGTANQVSVSAGLTPVVSLPNAIIVPGTLTLNANPTTGLEAATKQYVDSLAAGLTFQTSCVAATTANLIAAYNNGTAGVGATLTNSGVQAAFSVDGVTPAVSSRILIKDQTAPAQNGIYTLTDAGSIVTNWVLTRATDYDTPAEIRPGDFLIVTSGTIAANTAWIQEDTVVVIGTDPIMFVQFSTATTGVTAVLGTTDRITSTGGTTPDIDIAATYVGQASITTLGTITTGTWNGAVVDPAHGGTGVNNGVNTLTLGGDLTTAGAFASTFTMTGPTNVTFPTSGTLSTSSGTVTSVTGTLDRITVATGTTTPVIDIASTYAGQASITTVGTLTAGTWNAGVIAGQYGGTGVANTGKTITLGGNLTTTGAFTSNFTMTANTSVTFPTSGTLLTSASLGNYAVLNATNDFGFNIQYRQQLQDYSEKVNLLGNISGATTLDLTTGNVFTATATGNVTFSVTNVPATGQCSSISLIATDFGAHTITWMSGIDWAGGAAPNLQPSGTDVLVLFTIDNGLTWYGFLAGGQGAGGGVANVLGTTNRITSSGGLSPVIDIAATYVGQSSITTLGTVATGTWNGTAVSGQYGGTGVANTGKTITLGGNLTTAGAFASTFTMTGATNVTFPTSGTLSTTTGTVTNVSGTIDRIFVSTGSTTPVVDIDAAYDGQTSINTLGTITTGVWNGTGIDVANGGTGAASFTAYSVVCGGTTSTGALQNVSGVGSSGNVLTSNGPGALPTWQASSSGVTSVSGTTNRITSTGGATPVIDIAATYVGQTSITTLGTIATGTWHGSVVDGQYGGTGVANTGKTITIGGNFTTSGAFTTTLTVTGNTNVTLPTTGTLVSTATAAVINATNSFSFNEQYQMKINDYSETVNALGSITGATSINLTLGNVISATAIANSTLSITNVPASGTCASISLIATNFGAFTITWPTGTIWPTGTPPTLTASGVDVLVFFTVNGGTTWYGMVAGTAFA